jgi:gliding motility-associated-like protein
MRFKCLPIIFFIFCLCFFFNKARGQITAGAVSGSISACIGTASFSPDLQQFTVSGNGLPSSITATAPSNFEIALSPSGPYGNSLSFSPAGVIVYVRSLASAVPAGSISGNVLLTATGATPQNVAVTGTINPLPTVNLVGNQTVAGGAATVPINFTGTGQYYAWTNDTPGIGLAASGGGDIPSFTAINTGSTPITATITVIPKPTGFIYVASRKNNEVSVINPISNEVVASIGVGGYPVKTIVSPDGRFVYVLNRGNNTTQDNGSVSVINAVNNTVTATIPVGLSPLDMQLTPDGGLLFVANEFSDNVSVINTHTNTVIKTILMPANTGPQKTYMSPDGKHYYTSNSISQSISVINTTTGVIEATIYGFTNAYNFINNPDGSLLYVTDRVLNTVTVINTATNVKLATIPVGAAPSSLAISPDGSRVYTANLDSGTISVINTTTNTVIANIPAGGRCVGISMSLDGKYLYAPHTDGVSIISTITNTVIATLPLSGVLDYPAISPDGNFIYVPNATYNTFGVISTATNTLVREVEIGGIQSVIVDQSISVGIGCTGTAQTFTITVNPTLPKLVITANNASKIYGEALSGGLNSILFTATGLQNGETVGSITLTYDAGSAATDNAGSYTGKIIPSAVVGGTFVADNYTIVYIPGDLTVTPAPLTITADDATKNYGAANPVLKVTYSGFVNGESEAQLTKLSTISTTATIESDGGKYPIKVSNAESANYAITYVDGVLVIVPPVGLVIPNAFTPNNDGINDTWKIPGLGSYPNCTVEIFNRYGTKVYNSIGYGNPWDGKIKGNNVPSGVYYYIIDTKIPGAKAAGSLTVIR